MTTKEIQKAVDKWIMEEAGGYWQPSSIMMRMMEEMGELATEINNRYGDRPKKPTEQDGDIGEELADVLFTIICLANSLDIDLEESFLQIMEKYKIRDKDRHPRSRNS